MRKLTQKEFIERSQRVHGNKYDYSKAVYVNSATKVCIICPIHGEFWQTPHHHINTKCGCPICNHSQKREMVHGIGINDVEHAATLFPKSYNCWVGALRRCYNENALKKSPTYIGCSVCEEWQHFSRFKAWFDKHYVEDWQLDKDILVKGNKVYSPQTCCFVPQGVNKLLTNRKRRRGELPIGVSLNRGVPQPYRAYFYKEGKQIHLGHFDNLDNAFNAYKVAKEVYIKELADKWKDQLEPRVYEALYNYKVEITD